MTSTGSPRRSRLGIEVSPVPMDVAAVTSFFFVRSSSRGISSRYAAVKAPEVMTRMSFVIVFMVILFSSAVFLSLKPASRKVFKIRVKQQDSRLDYSQNNGRGANLSGGGQWACALNKHASASAAQTAIRRQAGSQAPLKSACCTLLCPLPPRLTSRPTVCRHSFLHARIIRASFWCPHIGVRIWKYQAEKRIGVLE